MIWIKLSEALDRIGHDKKDWLHEAILAGDVKSRMRNEDRTVQDLTPAQWWLGAEVDWQGSRLYVENWQGMRPEAAYLDWHAWTDRPAWVSVEIDQSTLLECFPASEPAWKNAGGRPRKWDWEAFWLHLCVRVHENGFPKVQAELVDYMEQWFIEEYGDHERNQEACLKVDKPPQHWLKTHFQPWSISVKKPKLHGATFAATYIASAGSFELPRRHSRV
jgi:hypothetical protein